MAAVALTNDCICFFAPLGEASRAGTLVTDVPPGRGLIKFTDTIVPFNDEIPDDLLMYKLMTTKLGEAR